MRDRSALEFKWGEKKVGGEQKKKKKGYVKHQERQPNGKMN